MKTFFIFFRSYLNKNIRYCLILFFFFFNFYRYNHSDTPKFRSFRESTRQSAHIFPLILRACTIDMLLFSIYAVGECKVMCI